MGRFIKELHGVIELELCRANIPLNPFRALGFDG